MNVSPMDGATYFGLKPVPKKSDLDMKQFMRLLTVQLVNQNPLEPMNDRDFFAQMAQLGQVQGMDQLKASADLSQAQNLMGKTVSAIRPMTDSALGQAEMVTGVVRRLSMKNGEYFLGIQEPNGGIVEVRMSNLQSIEPTQDLAQVSSMIGKNVAGVGEIFVNGQPQMIDAIGKVVGVSNEDGIFRLQVLTENHGVVPVPLSTLRHITE
jgi:flagellar basal-body rod modification protein FlgD